MDKLYSPNTVNSIIKKHNFRFTKSLGQNFLIDEHIIEKIIEATDIRPSDLILEIGPGMGTLTAFAAQKAGKVIAIEVDKKLIPILQETLGNYDNVEVINQDILKTNINQLIKDQKSFDEIKVIGNLPYYITTPIIMKILEEKVPVKSITIMIQKEVADRMKASPGGKDYGALSIAVQYYCTVEPVAHVPKTVFIPKPNVDSSIIRLDIRQNPIVDVVSEEMFFKVVRAGFSQRRKTLLNALSSALPISKTIIESTLISSNINPTRRAETLSIEEFAKLANALGQEI